MMMVWTRYGKGWCRRHEEAQQWCEPDMERGSVEGVGRPDGGADWIGKGEVQEA